MTCNAFETLVLNARLLSFGAAFASPSTLQLSPPPAQGFTAA